MKNLLFGLIATVLFSTTGKAQTLKQEDVRVMLAQGMVEFTKSLRPAFEKSDNVEEFKNIVAGCWYSTMPQEGNDLLSKAYSFLSEKTSESEILEKYNGKEMAVAALYVNELLRKGVKTDGSELFGGTTGDFNPYATLFKVKCRWYQLECWLKEIFGETAGQAIISALSEALEVLIRS